MSLETALDEERREVLNILEGRTNQVRSQGQRSESPILKNSQAVRSPTPSVRSMLDLGPPLSPKPAPIQKVRSMLDTGPPSRAGQSTGSSSGLSQQSKSVHQKARSDITDFRPRPVVNDREHLDLNADYQFTMLPSIPNQALPKRVTQGGKKQQSVGSMASIIQGQEFGHVARGRDTGRHNSSAGIGGSSHSPSSRLLVRSESPGTGTLMQAPGMQTTGKFMTDSGRIIDMNNAYRRLSDAALLNSGGGLSHLPTSNGSGRALGTGETLSASGETRLHKDYYPNGGAGDDNIETSDEEAPSGSSADEAWGQRPRRGRKRGRRRDGVDDDISNGNGSEADEETISEGPSKLGEAAGPRKVKSLLAAAEEERELCSLFWLICNEEILRINLNFQDSKYLHDKKSGHCWTLW